MEAIIEKKKIRNKGGKVMANARRRSALKRLEDHYKAFKSAGVDKEPYYTHGGKKLHKGRSFEEECRRLEAEITNLKAHIIG